MPVLARTSPYASAQSLDIEPFPVQRGLSEQFIRPKPPVQASIEYFSDLGRMFAYSGISCDLCPQIIRPSGWISTG